VFESRARKGQRGEESPKKGLEPKRPRATRLPRTKLRFSVGAEADNPMVVVEAVPDPAEVEAPPAAKPAQARDREADNRAWTNRSGEDEDLASPFNRNSVVLVAKAHRVELSGQVPHLPGPLEHNIALDVRFSFTEDFVEAEGGFANDGVHILRHPAILGHVET